MDVNRRAFLKGLALSGLAAATPGFASSSILADKTHALKGGAHLPIIALIHDSAGESAFLAGLRSAQQPQRSHDSLRVQRCDRGLDFLQSLHTLLHSGKPAQIIGLVDDASGAIIVNMARPAAARLYWLGQHAVSGGQSRHTLLAAEAGHDCSRRFAQELDACGPSYRLTEQPVAGPAGLSQMTFTARQPPQDGRWTVALGFALASLASNSTDPSPKVSSSIAAAPLLGNFVSFAFKT